MHALLHHCRSIFDPGFSHQRVDAMKPSIKGHVDELINAIKLQRWKSGKDEVDLQENFSLPLAFKVIYQLLGIPFEVRDLKLG
jgi:cytochrome P450